MPEATHDIWYQWLLQRRHGGDPDQLQAVRDCLYPVREKVLGHASLREGETLLDVGCGDGLIAFGALEKTETGKVIFSDVSQDLLDHVQSAAGADWVADRCQFLRASADDLSALPDVSVDVVTTRSVLIYIAAKQAAFDEFYRILRPEGRLSIFEPINRFCWPEPAHLFWGYDVTPVIEIARKLKALYEHLQPADSDPMLNFDERDLIAFAEKSGFKEIHLDLQAEIKPPDEIVSWDTWVRTAHNPKIPTLEEAMGQTLAAGEAETLAAHLRPLVEMRNGITRSAVAYLWAIK